MELERYWSSAYGAVIEYGPKLLAAVAIIVIAYLIGKGLSSAAKYLINRTSLGKGSTEAGQDLGESIGRALFWVTILVALPAALGVLGLEGLLKPMQSMAEKLLGYLPHIVGAGLVMGIGWVVATVAKRAVTSTLKAAQTDKLSERFGLAEVTGTSGLSEFFGVLVFTLLIIPISIAALDTLGIQAVAEPAKQMLQSFLDAIPRIFAAAIVLLLAFVIGRFASDALGRLLPTLGFDSVGSRVGITGEVLGNTSPSKVAGYVAFFAIMVFGLIEAAKLLNFAILSDMLATIIALGGRMLLGSAIIAFGVVAADFVATIVAKSKDAKPVAGLIRVSIIVLAAAMGLRQMGLADEIVNLAFALLLGALALGAAIAIGWGGKDTAGRLLEKWTKNL
jgi:Mechanosensitive ion channel, conserved TM helix